MVKKRLLFTLLFSEGYFCLSRNFRLQRIGDLNWLLRAYKFNTIAVAIDELIIINTGGENDLDDQFCAVVERLTQDLFIPVSVGGGLRSLSDADRLFRCGADKVVVNTPLRDNANLVAQLVHQYGSQAVVASIDVVKGDTDLYFVWDWAKGCPMNMTLSDALEQASSIPTGEVLLRSVGRDGTSMGLEMEMLPQVPADYGVPLVLSGGVGKWDHIKEGLMSPRVSAVATANLLNFVGDGLQNARESLLRSGVDLPSRIWGDG